jgi:hypothetical protein
MGTIQKNRENDMLNTKRDGKVRNRKEQQKKQERAAENQTRMK